LSIPCSRPTDLVSARRTLCSASDMLDTAAWIRVS
jgi:hypothetical protein